MAQALLLASIFIAFPSAGFSQEPAKPHYLQVEDLSEMGQSCRLEKALVMPIAAKEPRRIGIQAVTVPTHRYVHLRMLAFDFRQSAYCTTLWALDIKTLDPLSTGKGPIDDLRARTKSLCRAELIVVYDRGNAHAGAADAIRKLVEQCSRPSDI